MYKRKDFHYSNMGHYSLWLERYSVCRDRIFHDLMSYKDQIDNVRDIIADKDLILPLKKTKNIKAKMAFVDGGEGIRELLGAAIYFIRASGLILDKKKPKSSEVFVRDLDIDVLDYDEYTKERVELLRGAMEFDVALRCVEEHSPEYLFIDGSLYVNSRKKPIECEEYPFYRKKFVRLLKLCKKNSVHILGVSEDSKSRLFANYLSIKYDIKFPRFMTDSCILRILKGDGVYRTVDFTPQSRFESDDKLTSSLVASFPTVYVQPTSLSSPLRVDVPDWERDFDKIIALVAQLSEGSKHYGYPIPLYLVHLDARVKKKQADWSTKQLVHHISSRDLELYNTILHEMRRTLRPKS
ncbi:MAG: DNA double-strand break repair nuclease NurA [Candidatus Altiarchaeota archaeon]|nr:DNA double-strand break repair nuclease NurA [Candidatus Altiarchaeota archaeon]